MKRSSNNISSNISSNSNNNHHHQPNYNKLRSTTTTTIASSSFTTIRLVLIVSIISFVFGCLITTYILILFHNHSSSSSTILSATTELLLFGNHFCRNNSINNNELQHPDLATYNNRQSIRQEMFSSYTNHSSISFHYQQQQLQQQNDTMRILVVIASYDFSQLPHLEEVIAGYHDICIAISNSNSNSNSNNVVDIIIHTTVPYPVTLIDLWNSRITCTNFHITISLQSKSLRLFLVNVHRTVFYNNIDNYNIFIYTEDDIRITPTTLYTYLHETQQLERILKSSTSVTSSTTYKPSDFNVGIVRYEYNYPPNVIMDDNTRHATQNVTRVYWEHSSSDRPVVGNAVQSIEKENIPMEIQQRYITMKNHHQGMYIATRELLLDWKVRTNCNFHIARLRPGTSNQPSEGTQRVWMSSQMLYGNRHCGVQQVIPKDTFGALTVLHLPNKNYRRVGKYRNRQFATGNEVFEQPHESLLSAMELHISVRKHLPSLPQYPYRGITMITDDIQTSHKDQTALLHRRMHEYEEYVQRGGILSEYDMTKTALVEDE